MLRKLSRSHGACPVECHLIGRKASDETKRKLSERNKGELNPMYGVHRYGKDNPMYGRDRSGINAPMIGKHHSEEAKKKISEKAKLRVGEKNHFYGKKHRPESFMSENRIILCFNSKTNEFIEEFPNQASACKKTGVSSSKMSLCCNGKKPQCKGFIFRYKIER